MRVGDGVPIASGVARPRCRADVSDLECADLGVIVLCGGGGGVSLWLVSWMDFWFGGPVMFLIR